MLSSKGKISDYSLEFKVTNGLSYYISSLLLEKHGILVVFTTRRGGVSAEPYASLNLAFHVGDDRDCVLKNREILCNTLGIDLKRMVCAEQVHGASVALVDEKAVGKGAFSIDESIPDTDSLVTGQENIPLALFFADCVPVILVEPKRRMIAVVHAGWKGIYKDIISNTLKLMSFDKSLDKKNLLAFIGPSIGVCCFKAGTELIRNFSARFNGQDWLQKDRIDLRSLAKRQLIENCVLPKNIYACDNCCTSCRKDTFFSYRAEGGKTGRQAAMAMICSQ
ncbi:MAG: peptidoglycan editing factor PgeF [Actinomycetota bacterium]|nr:peptidoglycan editing factor PgeF [Actinomycetota bacterium]